jgi:hypothetical protein
MVVDLPRREVWDDILTLFIAILAFHSLPQLPIFQKYFEQQPYIILAIAGVLLIYRKKILSYVRTK